jgi:clan AA aspartic protease (TIGR02281 family)
MPPRFDPSASIIALYVDLIGPRSRRTIRMALDTGASYTIIPSEIAVDLGCDPAKARRRIEISTASGLVVAPLVTLRRMACLGKEAANIEVLCHSLPAESAVDGLLGLNFLRRFDLYLLFQKRAIFLR